MKLRVIILHLYGYRFKYQLRGIGFLVNLTEVIKSNRFCEHILYFYGFCCKKVYCGGKSSRSAVHSAYSKLFFADFCKISLYVGFFVTYGTDYTVVSTH